MEKNSVNDWTLMIKSITERDNTMIKEASLLKIVTALSVGLIIRWLYTSQRGTPPKKKKQRGLEYDIKLHLMVSSQF